MKTRRRPLPIFDDAAPACPVCTKPLVRAETGWVCPHGMGHTRIVDDERVVAVVFKRLPRKRPEAMSPHQWGYYKSRRKALAERLVRESKRAVG